MSATIDTDFGFIPGLRDYLTAVGAAVGVGAESCTMDIDTPVSAYLALDWRLDRFPDRDLALLWDECHGWAAAVETHSGEDLIALAYLGGDDVLPEPQVVARFLADLGANNHTVDRPRPPAPRHADDHDVLANRLRAYRAVA
jgi:hypothetical protein